VLDGDIQYNSLVFLQKQNKLDSQPFRNQLLKWKNAKCIVQSAKSNQYEACSHFQPT